MIWLKDILRIQYILDFLSRSHKISIDFETIPLEFLDWLHTEIEKSIFSEPKKVTNGLKDPLNIRIHYADEGELPFGPFSPKDSKERDSFIIMTTLKYLKLKPKKKTLARAEKWTTKKLRNRVKNPRYPRYISRIGRSGWAWYCPTFWKTNHN